MLMAGVQVSLQDVATHGSTSAARRGRSLPHLATGPSRGCYQRSTTVASSSANPTSSYGLQVFPRLAGMLGATHALRTHVEATGLCADDVGPRDIDRLLETTLAGWKILDIDRMLSGVEAAGCTAAHRLRHTSQATS